MHVAETLVRTVRQRIDFVGHVGGDDFVFPMRSHDWSLRLMSLLEDLGASLPNFYDNEHREAGCILGRDRDGQERHFALLSASVAVVEFDAAPSLTAEVIAERLRRAKKAAKAQTGYSCVLVNPEGRVADLAASHPGRATSEALERTPAVG
jgi:GGDEF domain-containing protein